MRILIIHNGIELLAEKLKSRIAKLGFDFFKFNSYNELTEDIDLEQYDLIFFYLNPENIESFIYQTVSNFYFNIPTFGYFDSCELDVFEQIIDLGLEDCIDLNCSDFELHKKLIYLHQRKLYLQKLKTKIEFENLEDYFEFFADGFLILDMEGTILNINSSAEKLTLENEIGSNYFQNPKFIFNKELELYFEKAKSSKSKISIDLSKHNKFVRITLSPLLNKNNEIESIAIFGNDFSEVKHYEELLLKSEEKFRKVYESLLDGLVLINNKFEILEINDAFYRINGLDKEFVFTHDPFDLMVEALRIPDQSKSEFLTDQKRMITKVLSNYKIYKIGLSRDFEYTLNNEEKKVIRLVISPVILNEEILVAIQFLDYSEFKNYEDRIHELNKSLEHKVFLRTIELEETLENLGKENQIRKLTEDKLTMAKNEIFQALQKEKQLSELKSKFLSMASHEFRTPLSIILSSTEFIEKYYNTGDYEKSLKHLKKIYSSVDNLLKMSDDVLQIGRIENVSGEEEFSEINIHEFFMDIVNEIKLMNNSSHEIKLNCPPNVVFYTNVRLFRAMSENILVNAIKFSSNSKPIEILIHNKLSSLEMEIKDYGIGIPKDDLPHVFEPFYRASNALDKPGSGLGLAFVMNIINLLRGTIGIESNINQGTIVKISLPNQKITKSEG